MIDADQIALLPGVDALVRRSRTIGSDERLVIHGGGNTSYKSEGLDHLGRVRPILVIKASGVDMRTATAASFVALFLDDLRDARANREMSDTEMVRFLARCRADLSPLRPSIETLLHAFLPAKSVDHVHADAICTLTNGPDPVAAVCDALGSKVAYLPYRRPGFALARDVADAARGEAVVLGHHGLVTWADDPDKSVERTKELVERAERYLARRGCARARPQPPAMSASEVERLLLVIRGRLSRQSRRILSVDHSGRAYADRDDAEAILAAGPATADHLLRVRAFPAFIRDAEDVDRAVDDCEARSRELWSSHRDPANPGSMRDPTPVVALVPGLGTVAAGRNAKDAHATLEVAARTHAVAAAAIDAFGTAVPLSPREIFDLEYWPLELAKLSALPARDLESRVILVTGAASGIGRDIATAAAAQGAHVALADRDEAGLARVVEEIAEAGGHVFGTRVDVTRQEEIEAFVGGAITRWGGIDGAVSNAGIAVTGRLESLDLDDWSRSLDVNATAHFLLARRLLPVFAAQGLGGSIVFIGSKNAFSPGESFGAYSVAKAAEVQLARIVALEGGGYGVRANVVSPDAVFGGSRLWDAGLREERAAAHGVSPDRLESYYAERSLLKLPVRGVDVADAVTFLLSERSSRTTGCVLTVDAGVAAAFPR